MNLRDIQQAVDRVGNLPKDRFATGSDSAKNPSSLDVPLWREFIVTAIPILSLQHYAVISCSENQQPWEAKFPSSLVLT
ncbi:hypothetical protein O9993_15750 [Vibrio lentus]|nr:hypothetical protein [Vibrio lentus]